MEFAPIRPRLIERRNGGWLAASPPNAAFCIGVTAETEMEAREGFFRAIKNWSDDLARDEQSARN
jgi:hypothetical protein